MKEFKLPAIRVNELASVVDSIKLSELETTKDIRITNGLVKDLRKSLTPLIEADEKLLEVINSQAKEVKENFQKEVSERLSDETLSEDQKRAVVAEANNRFNAEMALKFPAETQAMKDANQAELTVSLGNDEFEKLKQLFEKYGIKMYLNKEAYLQVADALEVE